MPYGTLAGGAPIVPLTDGEAYASNAGGGPREGAGFRLGAVNVPGVGVTYEGCAGNPPGVEGICTYCPHTTLEVASSRLRMVDAFARSRTASFLTRFDEGPEIHGHVSGVKVDPIASGDTFRVMTGGLERSAALFSGEFDDELREFDGSSPSRGKNERLAENECCEPCASRLLWQCDFPRSPSRTTAPLPSMRNPWCEIVSAFRLRQAFGDTLSVLVLS
jgi:hypothetical protein